MYEMNMEKSRHCFAFKVCEESIRHGSNAPSHPPAVQSIHRQHTADDGPLLLPNCFPPLLVLFIKVCHHILNFVSMPLAIKPASLRSVKIILSRAGRLN